MIARTAVSLSLATLLTLGLLLAPFSGGVRTAVAEEKLTLEIGQDEIDLEDFLTALQKATGYSLLWNPLDKNIRGKKITGGVKLSGSQGEIFSAARAFLTFYELVIIPVGPAEHPIHLVMDARQTSSILKLKPKSVLLTDENLAKYENQDGLFITTTIEVKHMRDLRNARNALTRIVTGQNIGNVTEVPSANAFVVTDFAPNVVAIYRLLKNMDRPSASSSTTGGVTVAIGLSFAKALEVSRALSTLYAAPGRTPPKPRSIPVSGPSAPRFVADARTNQILVTGSPEEIAKVREAVALLDIRIPVPEIEVAVIRLTKIDASETANVLTQLISRSALLWRRSMHDPMPSVVSHRETRSLLVSADAQQMARIRALVAEMDK